MTDENLSGVAPAEDVTQLPVETDSVEQEIEESESSTDTTDAEGQPKKVGGVAKRISELVAQRGEAERRAHRLEEQNSELLRRVLQGSEAPKPEPVAQQPQGEPKLDQFQTYEEYVSALADYRADVKIQQWEQKKRESEVVKQRQAQQQTFQRRMEAFRQATPDFDEVALNPALPVTDSMVEVINGRENGPALLYQLGQNPAEAARIAALPPAQAAFELGQFAFKASLPQPKLTSSAPPPVEPLTGGSGSLNVDPDKMSAEEWVKWRQQTLKR